MTTRKQLEREIASLKKKEEMRELTKQRNELKYGRYKQMGKTVMMGAGRGMWSGLKAVDKFLVPQAYAKKVGNK